MGIKFERKKKNLKKLEIGGDVAGYLGEMKLNEGGKKTSMIK